MGQFKKNVFFEEDAYVKYLLYATLGDYVACLGTGMKLLSLSPNLAGKLAYKEV